MWVMYDDVTASLIPASAQAVAGYVDGNFANFDSLVKGWPNAKHLSICVSAEHDADCLDCEPGDATIAEAPAWVKRQLARGLDRPVLYTSLSNMQALIDTLESAGIARDQVRLWCAHYTGVPHICGPADGFGLKVACDGTQWTDKALGRSLDESLLNDAFFVPPVPPKPKDPHHYEWFDDKHRVVKGFHLVERDAVKNYDAARKHPVLKRRSLTIHKAHCQAAAERIANIVIHEAKVSGKPRDWSPYRRGWRYSQLIHRAHGKRVVK